MLFVNAYKIVYLTGLLVNLALLVRDPAVVQGSQYAIDLVTFGANLIAWLALLRGHRWALYAEQALSVGRMLVPLMVSTVFFGGLVIWSPLVMVLWMPVFALIRNAGVLALWACCLTLLCLEAVYFTQLRVPNRSAAEAVGTLTSG